MDSTGKTREDLKCPEDDKGKEIRAKIDAGEDFFVTVLAAVEKELVIDHKAMSADKMN